jgi:hypothetical protein
VCAPLPMRYRILTPIIRRPLTRRPGGPVDVPVNKIAECRSVAPEQILLAWVKAKGAIAVTYVHALPSQVPLVLTLLIYQDQFQER